MDNIKNMSTLGRVYDNLDKIIENYSDLDETKDAEKRFWEYAQKYIFERQGSLKKFDLENAFYEVAFFREKQGFIYGFNYALELYGKKE